MKIIVNGEERLFDNQISIAGLLENLQVNVDDIAVEQNLAIVPAAEYQSTNVVDGDKIEIVQFIGGG